MSGGGLLVKEMLGLKLVFEVFVVLNQFEEGLLARGYVGDEMGEDLGGQKGCGTIG